MEPKKLVLNKETLVPIGVACGVVFAVISVSVFVTRLDSRISQREYIDTKQEERIGNLEKSFLESAKFQATMETKMDSLTASIDSLSKQLRELELVQ